MVIASELEQCIVQPSMADWTIPEQWIHCIFDGRYRLEHLVGKGGMAAVFAGSHLRLNRRVAIKILRPQLAASPQDRKRFLGEARSVNRIRNPHVIEIVDVGEDPTPFFVMEFLDGIDLARVLTRRKVFDWPEVKALALQIVSALQAAHEVGVIHRDVKPGNVFLIRGSDGSDFVKVLDFGIAKVATAPGESVVQTRADVVLGTATYMSPEQAMGLAIDARSDVYALGILLYRMLAGQVPFYGKVGYEVIDQQVRLAPRPPRELVATIPRPVEDLVLRALAKDPNFRFQSMRELGAAIDRVPIPDVRSTRVGRFPSTQELELVSTKRAIPLPGSSANMNRSFVADALPRPSRPARIAQPRRKRNRWGAMMLIVLFAASAGLWLGFLLLAVH